MLPHFLCIGATKSGTSWLYQNLRRHPEVWMTPVKELYYFNTVSRRPIVTEVFMKKHRSFRAHQRTSELLRKLKPSEPKSGTLWYLRYLFLVRSDAWYESLFSPPEGKITGDITPGYAWMSEKQIAHAHSLLPRAKIIYILRNPIEREWSQAAMGFFNRQGKDLTEVSRHNIDRYMNLRRTNQNSDYLNNLRRWESLYPPEQIFIGFFDHLARDPRGFLKSILEFLELDSADHCIPEDVGEKRNPHSHSSIPDDVAKHLANTHWEMLNNLHQRFANDYTAGWLRAAERWLSPV